MPQSPDILFSERFQSVYEHLGLFSYCYVLNEHEGIEREQFIKDTVLMESDTPGILELLEKHFIICEKGGLLHLNRSLFFRMNVLDLLLVVEPWLKRELLPDRRETNEKFIKICRTKKLSATYIEQMA